MTSVVTVLSFSVSVPSFRLTVFWVSVVLLTVSVPLPDFFHPAVTGKSASPAGVHHLHGWSGVSLFTVFPERVSVAPLFSVVVPASEPPLAVNSPPFTVVSVARITGVQCEGTAFFQHQGIRLTASDTECRSVAPGTTDSGTGIYQQYPAIPPWIRWWRHHRCGHPAFRHHPHGY